MEDEGRNLEQEALSVSNSPLFLQFVSLMAVATAAQQAIELMTKEKAMDMVPTSLLEALSNLQRQLSRIDFAHGEDIVRGAAIACDMAQPGTDIICSKFTVGVPQKDRNPNKLIYVSGVIGPQKNATIFMDRNSAEQMILMLEAAIDSIYPDKLYQAMQPKLILN